MEWISVKDDPPETSLGRILAYSVNKNMHTLHRDYDEWVLSECEYEGGGEFCGESVEFTHWMPLPEPPKE